MAERRSMARRSSDNPISERECDTRHEGLEGWVTTLEGRLDSLESKLWWGITLLVGNLVGVIILLVQGAK